MTPTKKPIVILGIFVADTAYRAPRQPKMGETIMGNSFVLGPGGKGSNQSVAAAMAGGKTHFITRLGDDDFAKVARCKTSSRACASSRPCCWPPPTAFPARRRFRR